MMDVKLLAEFMAQNLGKDTQNTTLLPRQQPAPMYPAMRAMDQINPMYTRQQPMDALAPMAMYQNYMQTGQVPGQQSSFQPWTNPAPTQAAPTAPAIRPTTGGGKS